MIEQSTLEIFVNIIQFMATLLIASEYYINRKKLRSIHKHYISMYDIILQSNSDKITNLVNLNKNKKILNLVKFMLSFIVIVVSPFIMINSGLLNNIYYIIIFMFLIIIASLYMMKYFIKVTEIYVEMSGYWLNKISQKIIFRARRNSLVGLGVFLFSISFLLNILIILELNKVFLMYLIIVLVFMVALNLGILLDAYNKYKRKEKI